MMIMLLCLALQCAQYTVGTDSYYECLTGEEIDLTPIQDEADEPVSQGRN